MFSACAHETTTQSQTTAGKNDESSQKAYSGIPIHVHYRKLFT